MLNKAAFTYDTTETDLFIREMGKKIYDLEEDKDLTNIIMFFIVIILFMVV